MASSRRSGRSADAGLDGEGERQVGVELALVALVEQHGRGAGQLRVVLEAAQQQAGGDHLDPGGGAGAPLAADRVPDRSRRPLRRAGTTIRRAAARAAIRRGWAITIRPSNASARTRGVSVVFPVPGGATRIAVPESASAAATAGSTSATGSGGVVRAAGTPQVCPSTWPGTKRRCRGLGGGAVRGVPDMAVAGSADPATAVPTPRRVSRSRSAVRAAWSARGRAAGRRASARRRSVRRSATGSGCRRSAA